MSNLFERKPKPEAKVRKFVSVITPPEGPSWIGVRSAVSEEAVRLEVMARTGMNRQQIAGRIAVTLLRPPAGKDYRDQEYTITRKSKEDFLAGLLGSAI